MQTQTTSNKIQTPLSPDGYQVGQSSTDLIGFWGTPPVAQQTGYSAITDTSGGSASASSGIQALTSGYTSTQVANGISTLAAAVNNILTALRANGILK